jgi:hypothetical protein
VVNRTAAEKLLTPPHPDRPTVWALATLACLLSGDYRNARDASPTLPVALPASTEHCHLHRPGTAPPSRSPRAPSQREPRAPRPAPPLTRETLRAQRFTLARGAPRFLLLSAGYH